MAGARSIVCETFSSNVRRETRSSTRLEMGRDGLRKGMAAAAFACAAVGAGAGVWLAAVMAVMRTSTAKKRLRIDLLQKSDSVCDFSGYADEPNGSNGKMVD